MPLEVGRAHLEIGSHFGDRAHLSQAEEVLGSVGAEWDLEQARAAAETTQAAEK